MDNLQGNFFSINCGAPSLSSRNDQSHAFLRVGPEWNSSDEESGQKIVKKVATKKSAGGKKGPNKNSTKDQQDKDEDSMRDSTVLFIGHLPNEFEERDLRNFLQQFGKVVNIRISRSVKSGNSRGYAFVRWDDSETARIVAETLEGYLLGGRKLVCHSVPNAHKHLFFNTDKVIAQRKLKRKIEEKKRASSLADAGKMQEITARLIKRERKKREKLAELGIDYDFPGYEASQTTVDDEEMLDEVEAATKADETPKKKRKDSIGSVGSESSSSRKRKNSVGSQGSVENQAENPQSEKKSKKAKTSKKRRESAP